MPRKGENIYKRKDGRWEARYIHHYENGKAKYKSIYGASYTEVRTRNDYIIIKRIQMITNLVNVHCHIWVNANQLYVRIFFLHDSNRC